MTYEMIRGFSEFATANWLWIALISAPVLWALKSNYDSPEMKTQMIYEEMRRELSELVRLIRLDEQYCAAVMSGKVAPDEEAKGQHSARAHRITEICNRYGIN